MLKRSETSGIGQLINETMVAVRNQEKRFVLPEKDVGTFADAKYKATIVTTNSEFDLVMALRRDVFRKELSHSDDADLYSDLDSYDAQCIHLLVTDKTSGLAVGTYRLNSFQKAGSVDGFYASTEFRLDDLPSEMLERSVEIGRACIAREHRNSRVLFLLWRVLAAYMEAANSRYLFGCCSVFTQDPQTAANVLAKLRSDGHVDRSIAVRPRPELEIIDRNLTGDPTAAEIPPLVNIYMRIGARVCGEPAIDRELKTVDFFVVFDLDEINRKYRKMFFGG